MTIGRIAVMAGLAIAAAGAVLAMCDGAPTTTVTFRLDDVWRYAQPAMPLLVEVRGRPYRGADRSAVEAMVVEAMSRAVSWQARPRFTVDPAAAASSNMRVVITFNPPAGSGGEANCAGSVPGGEGASNEPTRVLATFCARGRVLASVEGRVGRTAAASDRASALIRQVTLDMFRGESHP
jgi:phage terminase large subunit-like protein